MDEKKLRQLLTLIREGKLEIDKAVDQFKNFDYKELGYAKVDNHRSLRTGYPEIIFGQNKEPDHIVGIVSHMLEHDTNILITRVSETIFNKIKLIAPAAQYHPIARAITIRKTIWEKPSTHIGLLSAGTSDIAVSEEAAITAELFDNEVRRYYDVGVAGIHRFYDKLREINKAKVIIVVAGMEGALPSIVGGMVDKPVIAVPTSVGYGANFGGISALLGMLTSCVSGVSVVNIDNGFGAGYLASMINKL